MLMRMRHTSDILTTVHFVVTKIGMPIFTPGYCCDAFHTAVINEYFKLNEGVNPNRFEFNLAITDGIPAGIDFCPYCGRRLIVRNVEIVHM